MPTPERTSGTVAHETPTFETPTFETPTPEVPALEPGTPVRVKRLAAPGHIRTPHYLRGAAGTVERVLGPFGNPEQLAYGHPPDRLPLYRIRFRMADVWPDTKASAEAPDDTVDAEIYAHWLEAP